jgi:hypothetical protein
VNLAVKIVLLSLCLRAAAADPPAEAAASSTAAAPAAHAVELRGRVICLPEAMHALYGTELPAGHAHVYGFHASDGAFYTLLRTRWSEALFLDARLRAKDLLLKGRVFAHSHLLDVESFKSIRDGRVWDLYYYCEVCAIKSVSPEPCACCQGPMELVETSP